MSIFNLKTSYECEFILANTLDVADRLGHGLASSSHLLAFMLKYTKSANYMRNKIKISLSDTAELISAIWDKEQGIYDSQIEALMAQDIDNNYSDLRITKELMNIIENSGIRGCGTSTFLDLLKGIARTEQSIAYIIFKGLGVNIKDKSSGTYSSRISEILRSNTRNLTELASNNKLDYVIGRDTEIDKLIEILCKRQKNNPLLIGESGVGKTAIVEGLAQRIAESDVPSDLSNAVILELNASSLVSGTKYRGDFEDKIEKLLAEIRQIPKCIIFIDEMHAAVNSGETTEGGMSLGNILKPSLARGDITIIGATTTEEYRKHIETDKAFNRRFQTVLVDEPSIENSVQMLKAVYPLYKNHHNVEFSDSLLETIVKLSDRYINDRKLPDKAISILDETAAYVRLHDKSEGKEEFIQAKEGDVKTVISRITGINITDLNDQDIESLVDLSSRLNSRVIGQPFAVDTITKAIKRGKAGVRDSNKPIGSFLFVGPTGVGKTELSKALAFELNGTEKSLIRFDMSEFNEKHSVSKLIGSPPGYVGYEDAGQLTEAVRRKPYSVVLFDEIEKADPSIYNILLQILDEGCLTDNKGEKISFKNTVVIMTSNAGYGATDTDKPTLGFNRQNEATLIKDSIVKKSLESTFRPELLNRIDKIVQFKSISKNECVQVANIVLHKLSQRLLDQDIKVSFEDSVAEYIAENGYSQKYGARNITRQAQETVEDYLADIIISKEVQKGDSIVINCTDGTIGYTKKLKLKLMKA